MKQRIIAALILTITIALMISLSGCIEKNENPETSSGTYSIEKLNISNVTTTWDLSFLFDSKEEAETGFEELELQSENINETYRPKFETLDGTALLEYLETEKNFLKSLDILWIYAYAQHSLNVNDEFYESFLINIQDLATEHEIATSFATIKLTSISEPDWETMFDDEPGLYEYRPYLESNYIRFVNHRPQDESHAAFLADISNQRMKLETNAFKKVTNNVTVAGNITLDNGEE